LPAAPLLAAGELAVAVGSKGGKGRGISVKIQKLPGVSSKKILILWYALAETCKINLKSSKNPKIANPIFLCSVQPELQLSPKVYIFLSFSFCLKNTNVKYLDL
jgi:hypothetical protein